MSEPEKSEPEKETKQTKSPAKFPPLWLIALWLVAIGVTFAFRYFQIELSDSLGQQDIGVLGFISIGLFTLTIIVTFGWLLFFSRWNFWLSRILPIVVLVAAVGFLTLFKPRFGGNMELVGWEPRFWENVRTISDKNESVLIPQVNQFDFWQFLGFYRNATVTGVEIAPTKPELVWKQPIGKAWSGFAAVGDFAITMEQMGNDEMIACYSLEDGSIKWSYRYKARYQDPTNMGGTGPRGTPVIFGDEVYTSGGTGILTCLKTRDGTMVWQQDVAEKVGAEKLEKTNLAGAEFSLEDSRLFWGRSASPLVYGDIVIVPGGGPREGPYCSLIAFNRFTGEERWRGGEEMISYGSPGLARLDNKDVITIVNESSVAGHDCLTGEQLWIHPRPGNSDTDANCSQAIQVGDDLILVGKGYGLGGELIRVQKNEVESIWRNPQVVKTKFTIPVVYEDHIYCLSDGILECTELMTGKRVWKRKRFKQGQLLLVGSKLLIHAQDGSLHLVDASPDGYNEYQDFKIDTIDGICWNMIALHQKTNVLVRSELEAALIRVSLDDDSNTDPSTTQPPALNSDAQ